MEVKTGGIIKKRAAAALKTVLTALVLAAAMMMPAFAAVYAVSGVATVENTGATINFTAEGGNVSIESTTGVFTGYAWSSELGWIAFGSADNPLGPVTVNLITHAVSGEAKVLNTGNYIDFRPTPEGSNVTIDASGNFSGYAWSEDVGWINFANVQAIGFTYPYTITSSVVGGHGTIEPLGLVTVEAGGNQSFIVTADGGYYIDDIIIDGVPTTEGLSSPHTLTFTNISSDHTIEATFAEAGTRTWTGRGDTNNWSEAANWSGNTVPGTDEAVVFNDTSTKDSVVDGLFGGTVNSISINSGYSGTVELGRSLTVTSAFSQADGVFDGKDKDLSIPGDWGSGGTFTQSGGTFEAPSGTLTAANTFNRTGGTFNHNNGTMRFYVGMNSYSVTTGGALFYNVMFDGIGGMGFPTLTLNNSFTAEANVQVKNTGTETYNVAGSGSPVITVMGTLEFPSTAQAGTVNFGSGIAVNLYRDLILSDSGGNCSSGITFVGGTSAKITRTAGSISSNLVINKTGAAVTQESDVSLSGGMGPESGGNFTLNAGTYSIENKTLTAGAYSQSDGVFNGIDGTLTLSGWMMGEGGTFTQSGGTFEAPSGTFTAANTFNRTGGTFDHNNGTLRLYCDADYNFIPGGATFYNMRFDKTGWNSNTLTFTQSFTAEGSVVVANAGSNGYSIAATGSPTFHIKGNLSFPNTSGSYSYDEWPGTFTTMLDGDLTIAAATATINNNITFSGQDRDQNIIKSSGWISSTWNITKSATTSAIMQSHINLDQTRQI